MMICPICTIAMVGAECPQCGLRRDIDSASVAPVYLRPVPDWNRVADKAVMRVFRKGEMNVVHTRR